MRPLCLAVLPAAALLLTGCSSAPVVKAESPRTPRAAAVNAGKVKLERVPEGGLQPQLAADRSGRIHLLYYRGDPAAGDLFYSSRSPEQSGWSTPLRVNSVPGSAIAAGTIRGGQFAVDAAGAIHVVWNGSDRTARADKSGVPLLYARRAAGAGAFEAQRDLSAGTIHLDGGGSIASDGRGRVYVVWHAAPRGTSGELDRRVYLAESRNGGADFSPARPIFGDGHGACPCCGMRAHVDTAGRLRILYRSATNRKNRDMYLLTMTPGGALSSAMIDPWPVPT